MADQDPVFTYEETRHGDSLEATAAGDGVTVSVDQPWMGDTESGFGATCSVRLPPSVARDFGNWLIAMVDRATGSAAD